MDSITASTAQLLRPTDLDADAGWRLIRAGAMPNPVCRGLTRAAIGSRALLLRILAPLTIALAGGVPTPLVCSRPEPP